MRLLYSSLALASLAAFAPSADASIVLGKSIDGVTPGDTLQQVVAQHGQPSRKAIGDEESDYGLWWSQRKLHTLMLTETDTVYLVSTTSPRQRTSRHLGPGVTSRTTRARLRGERCSRYFDADRQRMVLGCDVRSSTGLTTSFVMWDGRVREVFLAPTD